MYIVRIAPNVKGKYCGTAIYDLTILLSVRMLWLFITENSTSLL